MRIRAVVIQKTMGCICHNYKAHLVFLLLSYKLLVLTLSLRVSIIGDILLTDTVIHLAWMMHQWNH